MVAKPIIRTRIPAEWENDESFRKQIWSQINKRIAKGKASEDMDGKEWKRNYIKSMCYIKERSQDEAIMSFGLIFVFITKIE